MRAYVGVTDGDWYRFLSGRAATEVNFWQPSGGRRFGAIEPGAPFLFKTHYSDPVSNRIVGAGFLSGWAPLNVSRAWEFFGPDNGCATEVEMRERIQRYRREPVPTPDPQVGCIMLRDVRFLPPEAALPPPPGWAGNIVQGKTYSLAGEEGAWVQYALDAVYSGGPTTVALQVADGDEMPGWVHGPVFGEPRSSPVRVGQAAFKALVQEAYDRRCAITGEKIVPVLQAAHIRPVTDEGENRVDNGLLLRSDVHTLFDRGYLAVHPEKRTLLVSRRLREDWGNGDEFYRRAESGEPIRVPRRRADRPNTDFLTWHADTVYLAG
ncbi:HNH endonuclease [Kineosporia sp. A_224]|uniref:HNH endonuclease n=1 Tax=Kineosporia sp. A_224 TaxID=1962180 RepID=UPI0018E9D716|nr:HNH endonuclease [Kineosporia sp. A_224]